MLPRVISAVRGSSRGRVVRAFVASRPPVALVSACSGGVVAAAAPAVVAPRRCIHASALRCSVTGISFSQPPPAELKVAQWMKKQEIEARRRALHQMAESIWRLYPREDWSRLTNARAEHMLEQALRQQLGVAPDAPTTPSVLPSEWETNEFMLHTLKTHCRWRYEELLRERKENFERVLAELMRALRRESEAYTHGTMQMTKNELTRRLTTAMGGKLPSAEEVEAAWQDRHQLPAIEWMEDVV